MKSHAAIFAFGSFFAVGALILSMFAVQECREAGFSTFTCLRLVENGGWFFLADELPLKKEM